MSCGRCLEKPAANVGFFDRENSVRMTLKKGVCVNHFQTKCRENHWPELCFKVVRPLQPKVEEIIKSRQKWCLTYDSWAIRARHELTSICHSLIATAHIHDFQMCVLKTYLCLAGAVLGAKSTSCLYKRLQLLQTFPSPFKRNINLFATYSLTDARGLFIVYVFDRRF